MEVRSLEALEVVFCCFMLIEWRRIARTDASLEIANISPWPISIPGHTIRGALKMTISAGTSSQSYISGMNFLATNGSGLRIDLLWPQHHSITTQHAR